MVVYPLKPLRLSSRAREALFFPLNVAIRLLGEELYFSNQYLFSPSYYILFIY
nr:MAG TPA: hypothetical protein [Caudoviricetes sp.]